MMWGLGYNGAKGYLGYGSGFMPFGFGLMFFIGLLLLIAVVVLLVIIYKRRNHESDAALDTLKLRLAKGEIDEEEYHRRKAVLKD